jgi:hypothetical protein
MSYSPTLQPPSHPVTFPFLVIHLVPARRSIPIRRWCVRGEKQADKSGRSTNNYTDLAQRSGFVSSVNHRKSPSSVSMQACSTGESASRRPARYIPKFPTHHDLNFSQPIHPKRKRHQAFYRPRDRRVNKIMRSSTGYSRETNEIGRTIE